MECLKSVSQSGREYLQYHTTSVSSSIIIFVQGTIVFSIHQPRYSIFKLFDTVLLMSKGRNVYHGSAVDMLPYFNAQGYQCELHDNPADFALDVLIDASRKPEVLQQLYQAHVNSEMHQHVKSLSTEQLHSDRLELLRRRMQGGAARSFRTEIFYVSQRTLRNAVRNPALFLSQIIVAIILGFLVGLVFYDMKKTTDPGIQNRLGAIFFMLVTQIFSTVTALEPLLQERALFIHVSFLISSLY
jgi:ATP-binding cassette, subfamily G (WHITE), member 2